MNNLFESFAPASKEEWIALLTKELKGESIHVLQKTDPIEEISFPSYIHRSDAVQEFSDPGQFPYTRSAKTSNNEWRIATPFICGDEKTTNKEILESLLSGTEHVVIEANHSNPIDFDTLLKEVDLNYCWVTLTAQTKEQVMAFLSFTKGIHSRVHYSNNNELVDLVSLASDDCKLMTIDAYAVQQAGGTTWQEIGIAMAEGHEMLVTLLDQGIELNRAVSFIQFQFGIGNKYFFELAKFRAFRTCWSKIVETYSDSSDMVPAPTIVAKTGFVNVSLKDPYTNLLRQTTEALSAAVSGIDDLIIQPYDWYSSEANLTFSRRMATNISLLLKEESYIHHVIDPAGGAYALDQLTETIAERAWSEFQFIERNGGIQSPPSIEALKQAISEKATMRIDAIQAKKDKRIGINIFPNPEKVTASWLKMPQAWGGLNAINLEQQYEQA